METLEALTMAAWIIIIFGITLIVYIVIDWCIQPLYRDDYELQCSRWTDIADRYKHDE